MTDLPVQKKKTGVPNHQKPRGAQAASSHASSAGSTWESKLQLFRVSRHDDGGWTRPHGDFCCSPPYRTDFENPAAVFLGLSVVVSKPRLLVWYGMAISIPIYMLVELYSKCRVHLPFVPWMVYGIANVHYTFDSLGWWYDIFPGVWVLCSCKPWKFCQRDQENPWFLHEFLCVHTFIHLHVIYIMSCTKRFHLKNNTNTPVP